MQREPYFGQFALSTLLPFAEQFPLQYLQGQRGCRLAYRHFLHQDQTESAIKKLVILVNGRAENILKWTELAYDFYQNGYDVLAFDHRGQGYSQRLLSDPEKGYLDEFRFYAEDMAQIILNITNGRNYASQHIVAHSLGALISSYYLAYQDHHIQSAVFSSPFFGVPLRHPVRDHLLVSLMNLLGLGAQYVFGKKHYQPAHLDDNGLSFCKTRIKWHNRIQRKYTELRLGGPTFRWVHLCLNAIARLPKVLRNIEIPVLILQSEKDPIVCNKNLEKFTAILPQGQRHIISQAKHEILFERDLIRQDALQRILTFLREH